MKGLLYKDVHDVEIRDDFPKPAPQPDEVLVKVKYCGICGSDLESYESSGMMLKGIILGHEFTGVIEEIGEKVRGWKVGDRVLANPAIPCNKCYWCTHDMENMCKVPVALGETQNGAMAEYINVKADRLFKVPSSLPYIEAAMVEPVAVAVYALQAADFRLGENAVIFGAGTIGLLVLQVLKAAGASKVFVIEPVESKQKLAKELGADYVFSPKLWTKINRLTGKIGPDHVFDCVTIPETFNTSLQIVRNGGKITVVGMHTTPFEIKGFVQLMLKNITIRGMFAYVHDNFRTALNLLETKKVNVTPLITKTIKLDDVPEAFKSLSQPGHEDIKIIIEI